MRNKKRSNPGQKSEAVIKVELTDSDSRKNCNSEPGFPIVGIGASAGGLAAFEAFFSGMPPLPEPGMAFILVQHLAPDHKSMLTELVRRYTQMQVFEVEDGMEVKPNCTYIIPPNCDMAFFNGTLQLFEPLEPHGHRLPIDFFFSTLAQNLHEKAICVVLSGTGSDGTAGLRAVKSEGGMVMAQSPSSCEYNGMPCSAIATGLVDFELSPAEMPAQLIAYVAHELHSQGLISSDPVSPKLANALKKVFILLHGRTGHDFSLYKPTTIIRRIERRMAIHKIDDADLYVKYLQQMPTEIDALFRDLLIGVTSFFRDKNAFEELEEKVIPKLFAKKSGEDTIRIWSVGCSTGEESYSLAMLLAEHRDRIMLNCKIQIFATDLDSHAIKLARAGVFPVGITDNISPQRLRRFFNLEPDGYTYRITKTIRDMLIFSEQDVLKDPPFLRIDLVCCRNLLIYFGAELQKKLIPMFHYVLNPGGYLFLGSSETVGEFSDLFVAVERRLKLYKRQENQLACPSKFVGQSLLTATRKNHDAGQIALSLEKKGEIVVKNTREMFLPLRELTEQGLLRQDERVALLLNGNADILYQHGRTGMYLETVPGINTVNNVLKMAREGLKFELTLAFHKVVNTKETIIRNDLRVKTNGDYSTVTLTICPVPTNSVSKQDAFLYLLILTQTQTKDLNKKSALTSNNEASKEEQFDGEINLTGDAEKDLLIAELKKSLENKEDYLQKVNEELDITNEELKSSNEEMQSNNEELQSTNEELETAKEELQSVNEELATVNSELQIKLADLSRANNDMNNLLAGSGVGTVFVNHKMQIINFTPTIVTIINLISGDIGRHLGHITLNLLCYDTIIADTQAVLEDLIPREREVQTRLGIWYSMRILPYRTLDNVVEGAVITFMDISEVKNARQALSTWENRFCLLVEALPDMAWTFTADGSCDFVSASWVDFTGVAKEMQLGAGWIKQIHPDQRSQKIIAWNNAIAAGSAFSENFSIRDKSGYYQTVSIQLKPLCEESGCIFKWLGLNVAVSEKKSASEAICLPDLSDDKNGNQS